VVGIVGLIIRELTAEHPILDLTVFKFRSYAIGTFLMTVIGFVLYGSTVLLPLLMQVLLGYTATYAGITNLPRGLASFLIMPIVGRLTGKFDNRKLLAIGMVASAYAMWLLSRFSLDVASRSFWVPLMIQGASLGFVFVPLTTITNNPIPNERMGNATSIFNLMRNIGASIGISMVETVQFRKQQVHINRLGEHIYPSNLTAQQLTESMKAYFMSQGASAATATQQAYGSMWGMVERQAAMLSYNDTFLFLAGMFVMMLPLLFLLRKPQAGKGPAMMH
jgi:DHA2 family multidrug resistance protein